MRLTALFILAASLQVSAKSFSQKVNLNIKKSRLKEAFEIIKRQTGYSFLWDQALLDKTPRISVNIKNADVGAALNACLKNIPLTYNIKGKIIFIIPKQPSTATAPVPSPAIIQHEIHGRITDTTGRPLSGVSVIIKGTRKGAFSGSDGRYSIQANAGDVLQFSFIGYKIKEITVEQNEEINVQLETEVAALQEMVIVGFGTQKKADLTGSVYQVTSKEIENRPVNNVGQALQGLVPNLNVTNSNGAPNSMPSLNIRGGTSFSGSTTDVQNGAPYVLVDGVEMDINQINPEDVESVSVLSDAASSAIYGARAAFGVVLITTKKGKANQKITATYSNMFQWNSPTATPDLLSSVQIQQAVVDAYGLTNQSAPADAVTLLDSVKAYAADPLHHKPYYMSGQQIIWNANVNPYEAGVRSSTPTQKHNLSLSGGSEKTSYYASLGYLDQDGVYKFNTDKFKRYNFMLNVSSKVTDWFKTDFRSSYTRQTYWQPVNPAGKGGWWRAMSQEPNRNVFMPLKTAADDPIPDAYTGNILSYMQYGSSDYDDNSVLQLMVSPTITPVKNWNIKADVSYNAEFDHTKQVIPLLQKVETTWDPAQMTTDYTNPSNIYKISASTYHYTINAYTDYTLNLHNHHLYGLAGFNQEYEKYDDISGNATGILINQLPVFGLTTGTPIAPSESLTDWAVRGGFYRFTYDYKGKYLLQSNGRYDLSSKFPSYHRSKLFPGISAGWRISQEDFMQSLKNVLSDFKFRASYASIGNQNVDNYKYISTYGSTAQVDQLFGGVRPIGIYPPGLVDPNITWETATTLDLGFDMTLFNKLTTNFSWYRRRTTDILTAGAKYPSVLGAAAPSTNSGTLQAKGFDLQMNWRDKTDYGLNYALTFTLSSYTSKVIYFNGNPAKLLGTLYSGQTIGDIWGYETAGIYQSRDQIDNGPDESRVLATKASLYPGDVMFKDLNGDDSITSGQSTLQNHGDLRIIGNSTPKYAFSFNSFFSYKNFDLNIYLQGIGKRDYYISDNLFWGAISGGGIGTKEVYENSWTPDRPNAKYPAYKSGRAGNVTTQSRFLFNAAYLRLKNLSIGYTLPVNIAKKVAMQKLRLSVSAYNLLTFSGVPKYFDPEVLSANYPIQKSVAVSLQATF